MKFAVKKEFIRGINKGSTKNITMEFKTEDEADKWKDEINSKEFTYFKVLKISKKI